MDRWPVLVRSRDRHLYGAPLAVAKPPTGMPPRLLIAGTVWTVEYVPDMLANEGKYGQTRPAQRSIRIALDQHPDVLRSTLLHEALHAVSDVAGYPVKDEQEWENAVAAIENPLHSLLHDNPEVRW